MRRMVSRNTFCALHLKVFLFLLFAGDALTQKAVIYFTHSTPFEAFLTALGIARDAVPLRADNYYQQTQRQWRTSTLSPFAANLAVVLYR